MLRSAFFLLLTFTAVSFVSGNDCSLVQGNNATTHYITSCFPDFEFCCIDSAKLSIYCCDAAEFLANTGIRPSDEIGTVAIVALSITGIIVLIVMSFICWACCSACECPGRRWFRRENTYHGF